MTLSKKQQSNLKTLNKKQKEKRELRRKKVCKFCNSEFIDTSNRITKKNCSQKCSRAAGVEKRKTNGTYAGPKILSDRQRDVLSDRMKEAWASGNMHEAIKKFSNEKYGVEHFTKSKEVQKKVQQTNIEKYGVPWTTQNPDIYSKIRKTRIERGLTYLFEDKSMKDWSEECGVSYSYFKMVCNQEGFEAAKKLSIRKSGIETAMLELLQSIYDGPIEYDFQGFKVYRPDFLLPEKKLIIECDGLAWHSDRIKSDNNYHKIKKEWYSLNGYDSIFFRSDEIKFKLNIVSAIIRNKLGLNKNKIFARNTSFSKIKNVDSKKWFDLHHLMGNGSGRSYGLSVSNGNLVAVMQVRWKNLKTRTLEISRFCSSPSTTIIGGFSKLLKHIEVTENPNNIITFIDQRYGNGQYLEDLGFAKISNCKSFQWTNSEETFHRMKFKGNSGYNHHLYKIWDCGQSLYKKELR